MQPRKQSSMLHSPMPHQLDCMPNVTEEMQRPAKTIFRLSVHVLRHVPGVSFNSITHPTCLVKATASIRLSSLSSGLLRLTVQAGRSFDTGCVAQSLRDWLVSYTVCSQQQLSIKSTRLVAAQQGSTLPQCYAPQMHIVDSAHSVYTP